MPTIYCVEDDNGIRELISCALRSGGYGVKAFPMAKPFYEELETSQPSLILLDIMLPNSSVHLHQRLLKLKMLLKQIHFLIPHYFFS